MARVSDKVVIPISFQDEKDSLNKIKQNFIDLQKSLTGTVGKNLVGNLTTSLNTDTKGVSKSLSRLNKPVSSRKEASSLGKDILDSFTKADNTLASIKKRMDSLWDSNAAATAKRDIADTVAEIERLVAIRDKWSGANARRQRSGNAQEIDSELKRNRKEQSEIKSSSNPSAEQLSVLNALIEREKELVSIQKEKEKIDAEINRYQAESGKNRIADLNAEIKSYEDIKGEIESTIFLAEDYNKITQALNNSALSYGDTINKVKETTDTFGPQYQNILDAQSEAKARQEQLNSTLRQTLGIGFGLNDMISGIKRLIKEAFEFYKSLDRALTDITIVSNLSRSQVQALTSDFIDLSRQTGMAIDDIAQASVIFFQQGLNTKEVMQMTEVTAQFAKVAGSTVEKAADQLTAAINGFQVGVEGAIDVADKLNAVAARSAASIDEIATAMSKAASQANQAGLSMDKFYAILATMEEVTREAPENIGTSMKTIMARMQQIKEGNNTEDETDVNDVETALKTVGISLRDSNGQLRDLESVLDELGPKWGGLDRNTQAYLGTIIAGTRQQSRFISMMQNWDRVLELTEVAENSSGQQALMHKKAMEGLDAAINTLRNSWQQFLTTLTNSNVFIDVLHFAASIMDNLSKINNLWSIVAVAISLNVPKITKLVTGLGTGFTKLTKNVSNFVTGVLKGNKVNQKTIDNFTVLNTRLKAAKVTYEQAENQVDLYNAAMTKLMTTEEAEAAAVQASLMLQEIESLKKQNNGELTEEEARQIDNLVREYDELILRIQLSNMTEEERVNKMQKVNTAYREAGESYDQAQQAMAKQVSTTTSIVGLITALAAALGLADNSIVQFGIAGVAAFGALKVGIKAMAAAEKTSIILTAASLIVTALTAVVSAVKALDADGSKAMKEATENLKNLRNEFTALTTKKKGLEDLIKEYNELHNKVFLTAEEQERLNDVIQSMGELSDVQVMTDKMGNNVIDMDAVNRSLDETQGAINDKVTEMAEETANVFGASLKQEIGAGRFMGEMAVAFARVIDWAVLGPYGMLAAWLFDIDTLGDKAREGLIRAYHEAFDASRQQYVDMMEDFVNTDNPVEKELQKKMKNLILDSDEVQKAVDSGDTDKIQAAIDRQWKKMSKIYSDDKMSTFLSEGTERLEKAVEEGNTKSLATLQKEMNEYYDSLLTMENLTPEQKQAIETQRTAALASLGESFGLDDATVEGIAEKYGAAVGLIVMRSNGAVLEAFNKFNLLDGSDASNELLKSLVPTPEDQAELNNAFANSAEDGYKAFYVKLQEQINSGELDKASTELAEQAAEKLEAQLGAITVPTWKQWGNELKNITQEVRDFGDAVNEISDNGGLTFDGFIDFMDMLDNNAQALQDYPELYDEYTNAIKNMDISIDESTGLIKINGEALNSLKDMEQYVTQAKIDAYKKELELNLKKAEASKIAINNEITRVDQQINAVETALKTIGIEVDANGNLVKTENEDYKIRLSNLLKFQKEWGKLQTTIAEYSEAKTVDDINKIKNKAATSVNTNFEVSGGNTSTGSRLASQIKNLYNYRNQLEDAKTDIEKNITDLKRQLENWDKFSQVDWSKYGNGKDKSKGAKAAKDYVAQLSKIAELLTHIEQEEAKINTLEALRAMQTGRANIKNLLEEIKLTEHLQEDYVKKYNLERDAARAAKDAISARYGKIISFDEDGSYKLNESKYKAMADKDKEALDKLIESYKSNIQAATESYDKVIENIQKEMSYRQMAIDKYIEAENDLVEAIKTREKKILDAKLEAIDKEIEAIEKVSEARRKAREEESDAAEMSGLQVDLQRALMDSSGASASQILSLQKQIKDKQKEMADNSFDDMVSDMKQQLEDEKEMEQALFDERLEEMDWYWAEVDRIMGDGVQSVLDTMKLYSDEYNQASEVQQAEVLKGWTDTFEQAVVIGKLGAQDMQAAVAQIQEAMNNLNPEDVEAVLNLARAISPSDFGIQDNQTRVDVNRYASGGMNYRTGLAWLDGTRSNPEAVLNAAQTKAFLSFTDDLAALRASGAITNNSNVVIDTISFNVESMSSPEDGEKAFDAFVNRFKQIGAKQGISVNGTANRF
jgi:TP901 family phage tail tape measure protein